jgi:hypothetical protein
MKSRIALLAILTLFSGVPLLGCSTNQCSENSTCGNHNNTGHDDGTSPAPSGPPIVFTVLEHDAWDACDEGPGKVFLTAPTLPDIAMHLNAMGARTADQRAAYEKQLAAFDQKYHAVPADRTGIDLTIRGSSASAVTIQGISVSLIDVKPTPPTSVRVTVDGACGGSAYSSFQVDLDKQVPGLVFKSGQDADGRKRVQGFPVQVTQSDPEIFTVLPFATANVYTFRLVVHWSAGGVLGTTTVSENGGEPFAVASGSGAHQYDYQPQNGMFSAQTMKMNPSDPLGQLVPINSR